MQTHPIHFLALGLHHQWPTLPEPLASLLSAGTIQITRCDSLHAAAATLVLAPARHAAILMDPSLFTRRELHLLSVVKRHSLLPIWLLPINGRCALPQESWAAGALSWSDAVAALTQLLLVASTPLPGEGNKGNPQITKNCAIPSASMISFPSIPSPASLSASKAPLTGTHNEGDPESQKPSEIHIAPDLVAGYDGMISQPLLSAHELRALLGASESTAGG